MHPPGEKMKKAIKEFCEQLEKKGESQRKRILQNVAIKYDLSPKEFDFLERHCLDDKTKQ